MEQIFKDHLGRAVRLTEERLAHIREHPEMAALEWDGEERGNKGPEKRGTGTTSKTEGEPVPVFQGVVGVIAKTLAEPELVIRSLSDPQAELYYHLMLRTVAGVKWVCVVVKVKAEDAFVLTAYLTDRPKKGVQLWPGK